MIHSMTGFGKSVVKSKYGIVTVEMKGLNHKFFEPSIRLPNGLAAFEDRAKKILHDEIKRGKIYLNVGFEDSLKAFDKVSIDLDMARAYRRQLSSLKKAMGLKGEMRLEQFVALPGVIRCEAPKVESGRVWNYVRKAITIALSNLINDREKEGKALQKDLSGRAKALKKLLAQIDQRSNINVAGYRKHLTKKIKELAGSQQVDKGRLEQEVALFAKNCDISEEITRMKAHLAAFSESLTKDREVGKKLDFIAQELHREINTIGSKANDAKIANCVIQAKSEVEKIREQAKNVE